MGATQLPATTMLEHADLVGSWGFSYLSWNEPAIAPIGESKSNAEITRLLAARMGSTTTCSVCRTTNSWS